MSFLSLPMLVSLSTYTDNIYRGKMLLDIEGGHDHAEQLKSSGEAIGGGWRLICCMSSPQRCSVVRWNKSQRAVHLWLSHPLTRGVVGSPEEAILPAPS